MSHWYRYSLATDLSVEDFAAALALAYLATESLHGASQTRLDAAIFVAPAIKVCVMDASTPVGRDLNRLFVGFLSKVAGQDAFLTQRITLTTAA
jgi:hypothetical protein